MNESKEHLQYMYNKFYFKYMRRGYSEKKARKLAIRGVNKKIGRTVLKAQ